MVDLLSWLSRSQCQFVNSSQAAVLRRHRTARQLAVPKSEQIQAWHGKVLATPRDINTYHVTLGLGDLRKTRDHINKVFKFANVTGVGVVLPTVDVHEKKGALCLANHVDRSSSLGCIQGRALISEFYESEFVATVTRASYRIKRLAGHIWMIWPVGGAGSDQNGQCQGKQAAPANRTGISHLIENNRNTLGN